MAAGNEAVIEPEPDERGCVIYVGQDMAGHWLVQDNTQRMEGRFVSLSAALRFAEAERQHYHARVERTALPLVPLIPFGPVAAGVRAVRHAA